MMPATIASPRNMAFGCILYFSCACATTPIPPTQSAISKTVNREGQDTAVKKYQIALHGNPWIGGYRFEKDGKDYSARLFLEKSKMTSPHFQRWKLYSAYIVGAVGSSLLLLNSGAIILEPDYFAVGIPAQILGVGVVSAAFLLLMGWYESDVPDAAEAYNRAIKEWAVSPTSNGAF